MPDIFQGVDDLDAEAKDLVATRLEMRAEQPLFAAARESYFDRVGLPETGRIHELGCGTGAVTRALARRLPGAAISGSDLSADLVERAQRLAEEQGLSGLEFQRADGQASGDAEGAYDLVLAHTVISHVAEPASLLGEALRLTRPGGRVVIHDGDYASFAFDSGAPELDRKMPGVYMSHLIANPHVMRSMPRLITETGAELLDVFGDVLIQGTPDGYFMGIVNNYAPMIRKLRPDAAEAVDEWVASCTDAAERGVFFGSCVFMTYVVGKPA